MCSMLQASNTVHSISIMQFQGCDVLAITGKGHLTIGLLAVCMRAKLIWLVAPRAQSQGHAQSSYDWYASIHSCGGVAGW